MIFIFFCIGVIIGIFLCVAVGLFPTSARKINIQLRESLQNANEGRWDDYLYIDQCIEDKYFWIEKFANAEQEFLARDNVRIKELENELKIAAAELTVLRSVEKL